MDTESIISIVIFGAIFLFNLGRSVSEEKKKAAKRAKKNSETTVAENQPIQPTQTKQQEHTVLNTGQTSHHTADAPVNDQRDHSEVERMEEALRRQREKYAEQERRRDEARQKAMAKEKEEMEKRAKTEAKKNKKDSSPFLSGEGDVSPISRAPITPMVPVEEEETASISINFEDEEEFRRAFVYSEILNRKYS